MIRFKKIFTNALLLVALFSSSCKKYLNVVPDDVATLESAFSNANETEAYLFGCYATLQSMADVRDNPGFTTSGEIIYPNNLTDQTVLGGAGGDAGFQLLHGTQNSTNPIFNYWDGYNMGQNLWQAIRRCNTLLDNINIPLDLNSGDKARYIAEAQFLKAYYHYWLIRMYGPTPIEDTDPPVNASTTQVRVYQQTVDSCFNYVVGLLDKAIPYLPASIQNPLQENGRVTSTIALAVKAEVLATQASPLFNGNPDYAGMKTKDGKSFFSTAADATKWQKALDAAKAAIDAANTTGATLYQFKTPGNVLHMSDSTKQLLTLQGAFVDSWNPEQIWTLNPQFGWQYMASPRVTSDAASNVFAVYSNFSVPLGESELFYTSNGVPINEDKTWDYPNRYQIQTGDQAHFYYIKQGYPCVKEDFDREQRYYADVAFDGGIWFGSGTLDDNNANYINAVNGPAAPADRLRFNTTGIWAKKLVPYQTTFGTTSTQQGYSWPLMRLTGLWLLYAECQNEVNGPGGDAYNYVDMVRARAGLQGVVQSWANYSNNPNKPLTKDGLRQIIHQERRIELAFEGQAGWDLRRWKELQGVMAQPIQGWNVFNKNTSGYYQVVNLFQPVFSLGNYIFPIQDYDLLVNPNLVQAEYW
jgi:hypothetical protein